MISVVLAARRADPGLPATLASLTAQVERAGAELIVATASDGAAGVARDAAPLSVRVAGPPNALVPELWGRGIERAGGAWIALASADCPPAPGWVAGIDRAVRRHPDAGAVGGPVDPPAGGGLADWAVWFVRFTAFLEVGDGPARDLPGENVVYRRDALEAAWDAREEGLWEGFVHRRMERRGEALRGDRGMRVRAASGVGLAPRAGERLRHGRHYGAHRPLASRWGRWARAATAPLLTPLLAARSARRVARSRPALLPRFAAALPWTLALFAAWSVGEARGYLDPAGREGEGRPPPNRRRSADPRPPKLTSR